MNRAANQIAKDLIKRQSEPCSDHDGKPVFLSMRDMTVCNKCGKEWEN